MTIEMIRGRTVVFDLAATDPDGDPVDLTGSVLFMTAKRKLYDSDVNAVFKKDSNPDGGIEIDAGTNGTAVITLLPEDTTGMTNETKLFYDVTMVDPFDRVYTLETGRIQVYEDVTQTTSS